MYRAVVLPTVNFDDEFHLNAGKVGDEAADGVLTAELLAIELLVSKMPPQHALSISHLRSQLACVGALVRGGAVSGHSTPTQPSPC
jgi:hypothetical protein